MNDDMVDVVIVGGGPAGMSAALVLGRARKRVLVVDEQTPRHAVAEGVHNFLSREGISPLELRQVSRAQIAEFPSVSFIDDRVERVTPLDARLEPPASPTEWVKGASPCQGSQGAGLPPAESATPHGNRHDATSADLHSAASADPHSATSADLHSATFADRHGSPAGRQPGGAHLSGAHTGGAHPGFVIDTAAGRRITARMVLIALGVVDRHPNIPGFAQFWGGSIQHCPYCHGWESRDLPLGVLGHTEATLHHALLLRGWTDDLVVFTNGLEPAPEVRQKLEAAGLPIETAAITALEGEGRQLSSIRLADGRAVARAGLFLTPDQRPVALVERMGLQLNEGRYVAVDEMMATSMPGVYAAGDCTDMKQSVLFAASKGMLAAVVINARLTIPGW